MRTFALLLLAAGWAAAAEFTFRMADFAQDSLARRTALRLDGVWNMHTSGGDDWRPIQLPAAFRLRDQYTLQKKFTLDSSMVSSFYELEFAGVDGSCTIYLNKKIIGSHSTGTAPFIIRLKRDDLFFNAENELIVELDSRLDYRRSLPLLVRDRGIPLSGDGLFRPLIMRTGKTPYVSALSVAAAETASFGGLALSLRSTIRLGGMDSLALASLQPLRGSVEIFDAQLAQSLFTSPVMPLFLTNGDSAVLEMPAMIPGFRYWQPIAPQRYEVRVQLFMDGVVVDRIFAFFALSRPGQWLAESMQRGTGFRFRAIEWVDDEAQRLLPEEQQRERIAEDLRGVIDLGANAVRVNGSMPDEFFMRSCDSLGLVVLIEIPVVNIPSAHLENATIRLKAKEALVGMIGAYRSHPSVAAWGLGSGYDPVDPAAKRFINELTEVARSMDSRPLYAGIRGKKMASGGVPVDLQIVDVPLEELSAFSRTAWHTSGPYILRLSSPLNARGGSERTAQQNQAYLLKMAMQEAGHRGTNAGILVSPYRDWSGEAPHTSWGPRQHSQLFMAGLLDENGQQRLAYQVVKAAYRGKEMPELLPVETAAEDPAVFQIISIVLIVLLLFYIRRDKRMSHYIRRIFIYPHGFYMDLIENRQVNPFITGLIGLASFLTMATLLASFVFFLRENTFFDELLTWFFPNGTAKNQAIRLIWHPEMLVLAFTGLLVTLALLQSFIYKMVVFGQRRYLRFSQIVTFTFWVPANFIFALPLAVVLFRVLSRSNLVTASLIYFAVIVLWFFLRALRGTRVILQITAFRAVLLLAAGAMIIALALGLYLEQSRAMLAYASYYWSLLGL